MVDNPVQAHVSDSGIGGEVEVINQLIEGFPHCTPLGEDLLPLPVVCPGHGGDDGDGSGGTLVSPILGDLGDAGWNVLEERGDGVPPRIHRVNGDSGGVQQRLDLCLQL